MSKTPKSIYLAGFDVFRPDAVAYGEELKMLCSLHGYMGVYPLDWDVPPFLKGIARAEWICGGNISAIIRADLVMANVNDFRGVGEPDAGTAFEIGFARALDKQVWAYRDSPTPMRDLYLRQSSTIKNGNLRDERGYLVEDFDLPVNLMIACSANMVYGNARDCLVAIAAFDAQNG